MYDFFRVEVLFGKTQSSSSTIHTHVITSLFNFYSIYWGDMG